MGLSIYDGCRPSSQFFSFNHTNSAPASQINHTNSAPASQINGGDSEGNHANGSANSLNSSGNDSSNKSGSSGSSSSNGSGSGNGSGGSNSSDTSGLDLGCFGVFLTKNYRSHKSIFEASVDRSIKSINSLFGDRLPSNTHLIHLHTPPPPNTLTLSHPPFTLRGSIALLHPPNAAYYIPSPNPHPSNRTHAYNTLPLIDQVSSRLLYGDRLLSYTHLMQPIIYPLLTLTPLTSHMHITPSPY